MKKFYKIFMAAFIIVALPILVACGGNTKSFSISIAFASLEDSEQEYVFESAQNVINDSENFYKVSNNGEVVLYVDTHNHDIQNKIKENENVTLTFYASTLSSDFVLELNEETVSFVSVESGDYLAIEYSFRIKADTAFTLSAYFFVM